jgi:hypothetical protein
VRSFCGVRQKWGSDMTLGQARMALKGVPAPLVGGVLCLLLGHTAAFFKAGRSGRPQPPIVILPGFGNDAVDYINPLNLGEEYGFKAALERRGFRVQVVDVKRSDWLKVSDAAAWPVVLRH